MENILKEIASFEKEKIYYEEKGDKRMANYFSEAVKKLQAELASASSEKPPKTEAKAASLGVARNSDILVGSLSNDPNGSCWDIQPNSSQIIFPEKNPKPEISGGGKPLTYIEPQKIGLKKTYTSWQLKEDANFKEYQAIVNGIRESIRVMLKFPNCDKAKKRRELEMQLDYAKYWIEENFLAEYQKMAFEKAYHIKDRKFWLKKEATIKEYFNEQQ